MIMPKNIEKTKAGWPISVDVKDNFTKFCTKIGAIIQEDYAGALFLWQQMPANIREAAKLEAKGIPVDNKKFWAGLLGALIVIAGLIVLQVYLIRWVLKVNSIIELLENIEKSLSNDPTDE